LVENIDAAFGFFEPGAYLKDAPLYPESFAPYAKTTFLQHRVVYMPGTGAGRPIFFRVFKAIREIGATVLFCS